MKPAIPAGYRRLRKGEIIRKGDKIWCPFATIPTWARCASIGLRLQRIHLVNPHIRRIQPKSSKEDLEREAYKLFLIVYPHWNSPKTMPEWRAFEAFKNSSHPKGWLRLARHFRKLKNKGQQMKIPKGKLLPPQSWDSVQKSLEINHAEPYTFRFYVDYDDVDHKTVKAITKELIRRWNSFEN